MKNILYYYHDSCGLGDFYLLFPIFEALREKHKNDSITLLSNETIKDIAYGKDWFDNYLEVSTTDFPISRFDKMYQWDVQRYGITLFYPPKKHFWEIISDNLDLTLNKNNFPDIFRLNLTDEEKHHVDSILPNGKNIILHSGHSHKFPYGKTPDYEWWYNLTQQFPDVNFLQVGTKESPPMDVPSRIFPDYNIRSNNCHDFRDILNIRQVAYLLECSHTFIAIDSIVAHLSLHSNKKGIVLWGSSNFKTHGHEHNINLEAIRHCGQPPCIDKGGFIIPDQRNQECCLMPENLKENAWPLISEIEHEIKLLI